MHLVLCLERLPLLPLDLGPARGVGVSLGVRLGRAGSLPFLLLLREWEERELPAPVSPSPSGVGGAGVARSLQTPISRVSDVVDSPQFSPHVPQRGNSRESSASCSRVLSSRGSRSRIEDRGRIRGLGHERVAPVDVAVVLALAPLPVRGQEVESVDSGRRPRRSLLVPAHVASGRGLLTAIARGVEALGLGVTGLDPRTDTGHAVTALDVSSRGRLTATARDVSERVPLPAGERGVTARGHHLSRIARGQACDYLAPLPSCGLRRQDGWPDEKPRRVWRRLPLSLLWFLKLRWASLLLQEGRLLPRFRLWCRILPGSFWACQDPLPWEQLEALRV